jgi:hypothetical protein
MKIFISILLLIITAFYVLPVQEILAAGHDICIIDIDELKEESIKKEKAKELFSFSTASSVLTDRYNSTHQYVSFIIPAFLQTIEIPPPDTL